MPKCGAYTQKYYNYHIDSLLRMDVLHGWEHLNMRTMKPFFKNTRFHIQFSAKRAV